VRRLTWVAIPLVVVSGVVAGRWYGQPPPGGPPLPRSSPRPAVVLPEERLREAGPLFIAVFLPSPEAYGFAVSHAATAMGLPLFVTRDLTAALRQPMVVIAGELVASALDAGREQQLTRYVEAGGVLVIDDLEARAASNLAGIEQVVPSRTRASIRFDPASGDPGIAHLRAPESLTISLGNLARQEGLQTAALRPRPSDGARVLARFEDGEPALVVRALGRGRVYALGASLSDLVLRPQINRDYEAQRFYDNHFEPSADVPQFLLRDWYLALVPGALALSPIPDGLEGALLLTHDVDFTRSVDNMVAYATAEAKAKVASTFFLQTKYIRDFEDQAFWNEHAMTVAAQVVRLGAEIESHTVAHTYDFSTLGVGSDDESARWYRPRVISRGTSARSGRSVGATLFGEVRVSRQLLAAIAQPHPIESFRSGYLNIHPQQWGALLRTGYRFDSSYSANDVLTAFPYAAMEDAGFARESGIIELPVLIADSVEPLSSILPQLKTVLDMEAVLHAVCVLLIHPDEADDKLRTELALIEHVRGRFWVGPISRFGRFWSARAAAQVFARLEGAEETVEVTAPEAIEGLTVDFAGPRRLLSSPDSALVRSSNADRTLVLPPLKAGERITLHLAGDHGWAVAPSAKP
jgi:hypothetical protein